MLSTLYRILLVGFWNRPLCKFLRVQTPWSLLCLVMWCEAACSEHILCASAAFNVSSWSIAAVKLRDRVACSVAVTGRGGWAFEWHAAETCLQQHSSTTRKRRCCCCCCCCWRPAEQQTVEHQTLSHVSLHHSSWDTTQHNAINAPAVTQCRTFCRSIWVAAVASTLHCSLRLTRLSR